MNDRRRQVMDAAHALFVEKGFAAASIQDILERSHISKGTFYNYFSSKNELLINIFKRINAEANEQRAFILTGRSVTDHEAFTEQIVASMTIHKENHLFTLYQGVFISGDEELKEFVRQQYLEEVKWTQKRIVELYGNDIVPYSLDLALLFMGNVQQLLHLSAMEEPHIKIEKVIGYALRRLRSAAKDVKSTRDQLISPRFLEKWFPADEIQREQQRSEILRAIGAMQKEADERGRELLAFLQSELIEAEPRRSVIAAVMQALPDRHDLFERISTYLEKKS
ncbi:TetR/AcrR family transcriptional regulator [Bacillus thermotolerans]|uniref:Transcriptional regulator, TetR family n=1 Tax=Bacillus thermotolerans TaxID=1221996 RepID=A0A0F5IAX9_BACTR|nr:TetR/AcrR family transcriptional regulator [Bacillus thermotolerans]KKB42759.1 Transcriptional regulator, TetR family [Bacillus thermotolerans]